MDKRFAVLAAISFEINKAKRSSVFSPDGNNPSHALASSLPLGLQ
ncbi:hypothetical protein [Polynucleobacter sp. JS-JIR-II-50]|nr:hypothetical protein [Polynucleobacter sp. JS-JIR-II-50]